MHGDFFLNGAVQRAAPQGWEGRIYKWPTYATEADRCLLEVED